MSIQSCFTCVHCYDLDERHLACKLYEQMHVPCIDFVSLFHDDEMHGEYNFDSDDVFYL